ncbi:MAG: Flp pilus assembly complex ATPase component TadA [Clostridia bacterium]|nr:Flp pilus assembly complex ATPase component TadA [Clostridia bacterium]
MSTLKFGQILLQKGYVTPDQLRKARDINRENPRMSISEVLISMNITPEINILSALAERMGYPLIEGNIFIEDADIIKLVPEKIARKHNIIPLKMDKGRLLVAVRDPTNMEVELDVKAASGKDVAYALATADSIKNAIEKYYANITAQKIAEGVDSEAEDLEKQQQQQAAELDSRVDSAPIVKLLNTLVEQAYLRKASDIHVEPFKDVVIIRMRMDGDLVEYMRITPSTHRSLITRLKILSNMNIAEKRIPLDGRFDYNFEGTTIDIRVSTLPTAYGEKAVLRLLGTALGKEIGLHELGMTEENVKKFEHVCNAPNGVVLVTGPTGSGKSTTLYTVLGKLNKPTVNITTIEDPIEKRVMGINQVQVNEKAGLTFAAGLRSILRQDPDIVMIGEIRDYETAEITMRASITGHLVLSTLHTNDSCATVARLIDMGVAPYLVAAAVNGILAQRLVKRLCPKCKKLEVLTAEQRNILGDKSIESAYFPVGCSACNFTGYSGRFAVHEVLVFDTEIRALITKGASTEQLREHAVKMGMEFMDQNVRKRIALGETSLEEYVRIIFTMA